MSISFCKCVCFLGVPKGQHGNSWCSGFHTVCSWFAFSQTDWTVWRCFKKTLGKKRSSVKLLCALWTELWAMSCRDVKLHWTLLLPSHINRWLLALKIKAHCNSTLKCCVHICFKDTFKPFGRSFNFILINLHLWHGYPKKLSTLFTVDVHCIIIYWYVASVLLSF